MSLSEYWKDVKPFYKEMHDERVAKTPSRIKYSIDQFEKNNIPAQLKNEQTGQFNIKVGKKVIVYYCSTGTVMINSKVKNGRGLKYAIGLYKNMLKEVKEHE